MVPVPKGGTNEKFPPEGGEKLKPEKPEKPENPILLELAPFPLLLP